MLGLTFSIYKSHDLFYFNGHFPPEGSKKLQEYLCTHIFFSVSKRHASIQSAVLKAPQETVIHQNIQDGCHLTEDENLENNRSSNAMHRRASGICNPSPNKLFEGKTRELECEDDEALLQLPYVLFASVQAAFCPG